MPVGRPHIREKSRLRVRSGDLSDRTAEIQQSTAAQEHASLQTVSGSKIALLAAAGDPS